MAKTKNIAGKKTGKKKKESKKIAPLKIPTRKIIQFALAIALVPSSYVLVRNSGYFGLADVKIVDMGRATGLGADDILRLYRGRNIFDIDIKSLSERIKNDYPIIERAMVKRLLPDTIEINIVPRIPIAVLSARQNFPVDRWGMVLSPGRSRGSLPVIEGLSFWAKPRVGERLDSVQLEKAFMLLDAFKKIGSRWSHTATTIDVSNHRNLSFYLQNGIEVKIGDEKFLTRLKMLGETLSKPDLDKNNIKYIDLRFRNVIIGPK